MRHPGFRLRLATLCLCLGTFALAGCSSREERAQAYYEKAQSYIEKKDYVKARIELRNALQRKPDLLPAWQALAQIEEHEKNMQGLASALRRITEIAPDDLSATTQLARIYLLGNAIDPALKLANKAGEIDPKNADVKVLKAAALLKLKDNDGALRSAEEAIALDPDNTGAYVILAGIKFQQGDGNGALKTLAPIEKAHGEDLGVMLLKVNIFNQQNNQPQVEALLHKLITLYPAIPSFRTQLIQFYLQHKRQDDAINEMRTIAAAKPDDTNAGLELVTLLGAVKGNDAARDELLARIKAGPGAFAYQYRAGEARFRARQSRSEPKIIAAAYRGGEVARGRAHREKHARHFVHEPEQCRRR